MTFKPEHLAQLEHEWDIRSAVWDLSPSSTVVEVGAYKGRWAEIISDLYRCKVYAFEPQRWAYEIARAKLDRFHNTTVFNCALGDCNGTFEMGEYETDGCSFTRVGQRVSGAGEMREIDNTFTILNIDHVDLMMINIEGYEYKLIPHMDRIGMLKRINNLVVQFHPGGKGLEEHDLVLETLDTSHRRLWDYGDVLRAWSLE